jgi:hypothetical protein
MNAAHLHDTKSWKRSRNRASCLAPAAAKKLNDVRLAWQRSGFWNAQAVNMRPGGQAQMSLALPLLHSLFLCINGYKKSTKSANMKEINADNEREMRQSLHGDCSRTQNMKGD